MSHSIADFEQFRMSDEIVRFADEWIHEHRQDDVAGNQHMNLLSWSKFDPHQALAIILTLLDKTEEDDATQESIALGDVPRIVEWSPDDFLPFLVHAVQTNPRFARCTKWKREHPDSARWKQLQEMTTRK